MPFNIAEMVMVSGETRIMSTPVGGEFFVITIASDGSPATRRCWTIKFNVQLSETVRIRD